MTKSKYTCPVCEITLSLEDTLSGGVAIWCKHEHCPSYAARDGAEAKDEDGAHYRVQKKIEQEVAQNDQHGAMCGCSSCMSLTLDKFGRS